MPNLARLLGFLEVFGAHKLLLAILVHVSSHWFGVGIVFRLPTCESPTVKPADIFIVAIGDVPFGAF
jgi:hypothetical protein